MSEMFCRLGLMPIVYTPWPTGLRREAGSDGSAVRNPTEKIEWIFQLNQTLGVTNLGFQYGFWYFNGSVEKLGRLRISLQGVEQATGRADGVPIVQSIFHPEDSARFPDDDDERWKEDWHWIGVIETQVNRGQYVALVIEYSGGPIAPPWYVFRGRVLRMGSGFPYMRFFSRRQFGAPTFGIRGKDSDNNIKVFGWPLETYAVKNASQERGVGMRFKLDPGWNDSYKIAGCTWQGRVPGEGQQYSMRLYDGGQEIGRTTFDSDLNAESGAATSRSFLHQCLFDENELPELLPDKFYRIALVPDLATTIMTVDYYTTPNKQALGAFPAGNQFYLSDGGPTDWSDNTQARPLIDLIISDWGAPLIEQAGIHLKVTPKLNDPYQVQHADDQIEANVISIPSSLAPNEYPGVPIGDAIESYSGYKTIEVFKDPDVDRSDDFLIHVEQPIEGLKFIRWDPWVEETAEVVFRLRASTGSAIFREVIRYVRVILP
jgi:hypothetical protein